METKEYELGQLLTYEQPTPYIVESTKYSDEYKTPVLTAGKSFIIGYTNEKNGIYDRLPVIIFDDFTTSSQYVNFKFKVKSSAMKILTANTELVLPKYIFYQMQAISIDHSTHKRYWIQHYSKLKVRIPSLLLEQGKIIQQIEELFSQLDKGVETLQTIKQQLAVYRQAVLKEAFEGKLTKSTPLKHDNLLHYIEKPRYGTSKKCSYECADKDTPVYRIPNIDWSVGRIDHEDIKYAHFSDKEVEGIRLEKDDILIIRSNGSVSLVGRAALISQSDTCGSFAGYLMRIRVAKVTGYTVADAATRLVNSHQARVYIENKAKSTSGVNNINSDEISRLPIPLFSHQEQVAIIEEIESRLSVCDSIEQTVDAALAQAEALRQSILKKAFEGGFTQ